VPDEGESVNTLIAGFPTDGRQREMSARAGSTVTEVAGSHAIYVSQPVAVAEVIKTAVTTTSLDAISA